MKNFDVKDFKYFLVGLSLPILYLFIFWSYGIVIVESLQYLIDTIGPKSSGYVQHDEFSILFVTVFGLPFLGIGLAQKFLKDNRWKSFGYGFFVGMIPFIFFFLRYQISLL